MDVQLAMLEVVVVDRKGRHVRGLPPSAFHLKEGRREVPIITFDEITLNQEPGTASPNLPEISGASGEPQTPASQPERPDGVPSPAAAPTGPVSAGQAARARKEGKRWFVLLFDGYFNPSALAISQARRAAKKWLKETLREGDQVAVYQLLPHLSTVQSFTSRRKLLNEAIDSIRIMPGSSMGQEMIRQRLEQTQALPRDFREQQIRNAGSFGSQLDRSERDNFYVSLTSLGQALGPLAGTKAVVLFSGGFPITRSWDTNSTGGLTRRFKRMMEVLEYYGVRVYSFDVGEENTFTGAEQARNIRQMVDNLGLGTEWLDSLQVGAQIDSAISHQEVLAILGNETGGRFIRGKELPPWPAAGYRRPLALLPDRLPTRRSGTSRTLCQAPRKRGREGPQGHCSSRPLCVRTARIRTREFRH
ncbi:MAG: VWA domain-containing protein [Acidobacteriota bacterium]|nr:VWA domain-containing protein [Acidobacteriota bacterium]